MARCKIGVQLHPQDCTITDLRAAWQHADATGLDSVWVWDHFFPLYGSPDAAHFEGWSLLAAIAADTTAIRFGALVTCNSYRNPELLADMARTVDQLSGGRLYLGLGAGWFERDYTEYGYDFGTAPRRLRELESAIPRIKGRIAKLNPPPAGSLPLLIGGSGEKVTLRLVAEHADAWNTFGPIDNFRRKSEVLDDWRAKIGRDPASIERTVAVPGTVDPDGLESYVDAGADHIIFMIGAPFDLAPALAALEL
ncbi:MAG: LLM class F420-dependent oxidoreductase [Acidimicrobiales bacterium]